MPDKYDQIICKVIGMTSTEDINRELLKYDNLNWKLLMDKLEYYQVAQPFYYNLVKTHLDGIVPGWMIDLFKQNQRETIATNIRKYIWFTKLINRLSDQSIHVIPLKGVYLADIVYYHIGLRPMGDIDLLVDERDIPKIDITLREVGYTVRDYWLQAEKKVVHSLPPFTQAQAPDIDIHWAFTGPDNPFCIDYDGIWDRAQTGIISGARVNILDPVDQLLSLSIHLSYHHHFMAGLRSLVDIREYLIKSEVSFPWKAALERAADWKCRRVLFLSLYLLHHYLNTQIPDYVMAELSPEDFSSEVEHWAVAQLFPTLTEKEAYVSITLSEVWNRKGFWNKLRGILYYLIPSKETISNKYGVSPESPELLVYYLRRVKDLFRKHGKNIFRLFAGKEDTREKSMQNAEGFLIAEWLAKG